MRRYFSALIFSPFTEIARCPKMFSSTGGGSDFVFENQQVLCERDPLGVVRNHTNDVEKSRLGIPVLPKHTLQTNLERNNTAEDTESKNKQLITKSNPDHLPFDDDGFAETILEMEADGAIDESWQDNHKAYFEDAKEICSILQSMKVRDICCVDTSRKTSNFDYIIFGTCEGSRHIHLASWAVQEADQVHRISKVKRKKTDESWDVVPVGRILVNLMTESCRNDLSLERKWTVTSNMDPLQVANAPVSEGRYSKAHGLWTLTINLQDLEDFEIDYCKETLLRQW